MRGLLLVRPEGLQLPFGLDDLEHELHAEAADQFVLEIGVAHEEADGLHLGAREVRPKPNCASARRNAGSWFASQSPPTVTSGWCVRYSSRKRQMFVAPPI